MGEMLSRLGGASTGRPWSKPRLVAVSTLARPWHQGLRGPSGVAWEQTRQHPNQGSAGAWQRSAPFIESTSAFGNNMHVTVLACSVPFIVISVIRHDASCKRASSPRRPFHWRLGLLESRDGLAIAHYQLANNDRKQTWLTESSGTNGARAFRPPSVVKFVFLMIRTASSQKGTPTRTLGSDAASCTKRFREIS